MTFLKKISFVAVSALAALALAACGNSNQTSESSQSQASSSTTRASSSASSSTSSSTSSSSSKASDNAGLDGTYKASHEGEERTLSISGNKGTLTKVEADGEKEVEQVDIDPVNQTMVIDNEVKRYRLEGNQLIIEDRDQEVNDDDTVTYTKQ